MYVILTGKQAKQQIAPDETRQMKREVQLIWQVERTAFGLLEKRQILEHDHTFAKKGDRIQEQTGR